MDIVNGIVYCYSHTYSSYSNRHYIKMNAHPSHKSKYKDNMRMEEAVRLGIKALKKALGAKFDVNRLDVAVVAMKDKKFRRLKKEEIIKFSR